MTNVSGGLMTSEPTETGHSMQLQATQRPFDPGQSESDVHVQPSLKHGSAGKSLKVRKTLFIVKMFGLHLPELLVASFMRGKQGKKSLGSRVRQLT